MYLPFAVLVGRLAGRARAGGPVLTGEGGLLAQLTKRFALVARMVAAERVGAVTGVVGAAGGLGGFFPPLVMGLVYGTLGGYGVGFALLAVTALAAALFTATVVQHRATPRPP